MAEENKHVPPGTTPPEEEKSKGVSKTEFTKFQKDVAGALGGITEALGGVMESLNEIKSKPAIVADSNGVRVSNPVYEEAGPQEPSMVPQAWRRLTDEILGPEFRIELDLPENGGQKFSVYVPREKSNAHKDHWTRHGQDKRTRELANTGVKGVKDWALKIRKNITASGIKLPYYEDPDPRQGIIVR